MQKPITISALSVIIAETHRLSASKHMSATGMGILTLALLIHILGVCETVPISDGGCRGIARYEVQFRGDWSRERFPKMYPMYRPPAQWSKVIGRTHSGSYHLYSLGTPASKGLQLFAEKGATALLDQESQGSKGILDSFTAAGIPRGVGETSAKVFVNGQNSKVSFASKIVPSPDWFVGVDSLDLCRDGDWLPSANVDLQPLDAGTDQGLTFTAPNWPSKPHEAVYQITSSYPDHEASSFFYPSANELPPIGQLFVKLIEWTDGDLVVAEGGEETGELVAEGGEDNNEAAEDTLEVSSGMLTMDCNVSEWSAWSPCSKTCGYGQKTRHRVVTEQPENGGAACPPLSEEELCGSMRSCRWRHFDFSRLG